MTGFTIRAFHDGDGPALAELHRKSILATSDAFYTSAERTSWAEGISPDGYSKAIDERLEVAVDREGQPIGFSSHKEEHIVAVYVDPDWQGAGIGSSLLRVVEARISTIGHHVAKVHAALPAIAFYERHGYRIVEQTSHQTRGGMVLQARRLEKVIA